MTKKKKSFLNESIEWITASVNSIQYGTEAAKKNKKKKLINY